MKREFIYEEYTSDKLYRFEICQKDNSYELWVQKKYTDSTTDNSYYYDIPDVIHITDSLEKAKEIGREGFRKLSPPSERAKDDLIELSGTKIERIAQAVRLAYTDVSDQEIKHFEEVYEKLGIRLLPAAKRLYTQYGGVFRNHYIELDEPQYNGDIFLFFYADLVETRWPNEMERRFEEAMSDIDIVRERAGQEVCPVGDIGFYYPPIVYVGEDGHLYCLYEYKEEIDIFCTPEEIIANQLSNHMPKAIVKRKKQTEVADEQ